MESKLEINQPKFVALVATEVYNGEWQCANVPYKIISNDGVNSKLMPFNKKKSITISNEKVYPLESDETWVYTANYPNGKIAITEFGIKPISIKTLKKHFKGNNDNILKAIEKADQDSFVSKGNQFCITIDNFNKYKIDNTTSCKLERIGDPLFNRSTRHSPPIPKTFTREDFENSSSYPAPIGIREEDFALPSEQNEILIELLNQIFSCKNAPECPPEIKDELGLSIIPDSHKCLWCGEIMDIMELNQEYCSKEHSINFCHRIPEVGTKKGNVYIGHCSCNREQGGYSEEERIEQIIRLVKNNPSYTLKLLQGLGLA
jgi:hypothetical protein